MKVIIVGDKPQSLVEIKSLTLKVTRADMDHPLVEMHFKYPFLFEPHLEKLVVVVNGRETEVKL